MLAPSVTTEKKISHFYKIFTLLILKCLNGLCIEDQRFPRWSEDDYGRQGRSRKVIHDLRKQEIKLTNVVCSRQETEIITVSKKRVSTSLQSQIFAVKHHNLYLFTRCMEWKIQFWHREKQTWPISVLPSPSQQSNTL